MNSDFLSKSLQSSQKLVYSSVNVLNDNSHKEIQSNKSNDPHQQFNSHYELKLQEAQHSKWFRLRQDIQQRDYGNMSAEALSEIYVHNPEHDEHQENITLRLKKGNIVEEKANAQITILTFRNIIEHIQTILACQIPVVKWLTEQSDYEVNRPKNIKQWVSAQFYCNQVAKEFQDCQKNYQFLLEHNFQFQDHQAAIEFALKTLQADITEIQKLNINIQKRAQFQYQGDNQLQKSNHSYQKLNHNNELNFQEVRKSQWFIEHQKLQALDYGGISAQALDEIKLNNPECVEHDKNRKCRNKQNSYIKKEMNDQVAVFECQNRIEQTQAILARQIPVVKWLTLRSDYELNQPKNIHRWQNVKYYCDEVAKELQDHQDDYEAILEYNPQISDHQAAIEFALKTLQADITEIQKLNINIQKRIQQEE